MQHNHWKAQQIQRFATKIALWGIGLILLVVNTVLKKTIDFNIVSMLIGVFTIIFNLFLIFLDRVLWRTKIMRFPLLENYWTPIIEGRWKGILIRDGEPHDFVIEITQSFTSVSCITYSKHSSSSGIATEILYNKQLKKYQLIYYWRGKTKNVQPNTGDTNTFDGFTVLDIQIKSGKALSMTGEYFTNRQPNQTRGTIDIKFEQKELKKNFN